MLSIILPTIRLERLPKLIQSINESYHSEYELICVSPYEMPQGLYLFMPNIKWVVDKGNSVRCQQIGLTHAEGLYVHRAVDDSLYEPNALDEAMDLARPYNIVITKHTETNDQVDKTHPCFQDMADEKFFKFSYHKQTIRKYVPEDGLIINFGIYPTALLKEMGGWDSVNFESIALAEVDLSVRAKFKNVPTVLSNRIVLCCGWMPGIEGDHAPMHHAFPVDLNKYNSIYDDISCWDRVNIDINNWKKSPDIWARRF